MFTLPKCLHFTFPARKYRTIVGGTMYNARLLSQLGDLNQTPTDTLNLNFGRIKFAFLNPKLRNFKLLLCFVSMLMFQRRYVVFYVR